jgi:hypothetical protein
MAIKKKIPKKKSISWKPRPINWKPLQKFLAYIGLWLVERYEHIKAHWPRYMLSIITATFTATAAQTLTGQAYYALMAVLLAEGMWLYWLSRVEVFENKGQQFVSVLMFIVCSIAIILTDIASAVLLANGNDAQQFFQTVPAWVASVVTNVTPILGASNLITYGLFEFFSDTNRDKRDRASKKRHMERVTDASKRDIAKLNSRIHILRLHRRMDIIERRQRKVYGEDIVAKVNSIMRLELMSLKEDTFDFLQWLQETILKIKNFMKGIKDEHKPKK